MAEVFCSGCFNVFPDSEIRILPHFNESAGRFVTTYRCETCAPAAFAETRTKLTAADEADLPWAAFFFKQHGVFLLDTLGDGPIDTDAVRSALLQLVDKLEAGTLSLSIGETRPL